ncbi:MAG: hypothetical protein ACRD4E_04400 [Bryobacteraceae bacterium]
MKIYDTAASGIPATQTSGPGSVQAGRSGQGGRVSSPQGDHVDLSRLSDRLNTEPASDSGRSQRVSQLEGLVQSGGYQVNAGAVSAGLIHQNMRA